MFGFSRIFIHVDRYSTSFPKKGFILYTGFSLKRTNKESSLTSMENMNKLCTVKNHITEFILNC